MLLGIFYHLALFALFFAAFPKLIYQRIMYKKYRQCLWQRLGFHFPAIVKKGKKLIWIHAVSVGEVRAIAHLAKRFKEKDDNPLLIISTITETGFAEAKKNLPEADYHVFLPFDMEWIIGPIIRRTVPDLVILSETDFWYHFLYSSKKVGAKIILVNGKLSQRSMEKWKKIPWLTQRLFSLIDLFCVQSMHYYKRFQQIGIPDNQLMTTGNLKFDGHHPKSSDLLKWKKDLGIPPQNLVLVAGSTHDPEENLLIASLTEVWKTIPDLSLLIVPRHPERFDVVADLLSKSGIFFQRYSQRPSSKSEGKVLLIDTMGILCQCYQLADVAFVGGSFTPKVGGHNIIEPAWYSVPVLFGPYMHAQPELVELISHYQAGFQVSEKGLTKALIRLLKNPVERKICGQAGAQMAQDLAGATERTYEAILSLEHIPK